MRKYHVEITKVAERDIESVGATIKWIKELERQLGSLENLPNRCPIIPEAKELGREYRHLIYGDYRTIFCVQGLKVLIMRVIHSARLLNLQMFEE